MKKYSDKQPNPPDRDTNPGSRSSLFTGASIIVSFIFIAYGTISLATIEANTWRLTLALIMTLYGLYSLAIVAYAHKKRGRRPVIAIQIGATVFLVAYVFIVVVDSMIVSGVGTIILVAFGLWCNWIAVIKIVSKSLASAPEKRSNYA